MSTHHANMNAKELQTSIALAAVYALRMLGMFLIIPVFALYAPTLVGGDNKAWVGFAMGGAYGLTQAILQLPLGMASDKWGRKKIIYIGLLIFALGSFLASYADNIYLLAFARAVQGAGAVSAAITALLADLTREQVRTRAMAMIGISIGITFAASLVLGPVLDHIIGVKGIFTLTGILSLVAIVAIHFLVPNPQELKIHDDTQAKTSFLPIVLKDAQLLRLNFGIFALHTAQMSLFMVLPIALVKLGLPKTEHAHLYLPIVIAGFVFMIPAIIYGEKKQKLKQVFVFSIALMVIAQLCLAFSLDHFVLVCSSLVIYFIAFNILEATLPSLISKIAPTQAKGTAMGVYNTAQSLGLFAGGAGGGLIFAHFSFLGIFTFCSILMIIWLILAITAAKPPAAKNIMFSLSKIWQNHSQSLTALLTQQSGILEIAFSEDNQTLYLKITQEDADLITDQIEQILSGEPK
ncbi:MFS transporter [Neisseria sp. Ec49-e6-T10]|uniref:MFS transporter n=1 Tax=Neisseria sp. Ec49-e6-T10 TaxID=3140744 RepID=UPI003EBAB19F